MIFDFFATGKVPENFAILDFGSTGVHALIFDARRFKDTGFLDLVGIGYEAYPEGAVTSSLITSVDQFRETVRASLKKASFNCGFNPTHLILGLSGEFSKAVSVKVKITRENSENPLTAPEWASLSIKIKNNLLTEVCEEMAAVTGNDDIEVELLEKRLVGKIPLDQSFAEMTLDYLVSFTQKSTVDLMNGLVKKLNKRLLIKTSKVLNIVSLLNDSKKDKPLNSLLIDLNGGSTDVALVLDGFLIGVRTIPLGSAAFVDPSPSGVLQDWLNMLTVALSDFDGVKAYPPQIILYGSGAKLAGVRDTLASFSWPRNFPFVSLPEVYRFEDLVSIPFLEDKTGELGEHLPSVVLAGSFLKYAEDRT